MKKAIYKIENKINHKIYIGQSIDPQRRFREHCCKHEKYISLIDRAIHKYGKENFSFEIIGWFENYNEKEKEYIQFYRTLAPYGYNIALGGKEPPHYKGEKNPQAKLTQTQADKVIKQLLDWKIPRKTIVKSNFITYDIVRHINEGSSWRKEELSYPLRPSEKYIDDLRVNYIKKLCCDPTIPLNQIGAKVGWGRSSAKMINQGHNHFDERLKYPIRNNIDFNKKILDQETCIDYLLFEE